MELETQVRTLAQEAGASLFGIASRERLVDMPPSANPDYLLPSTRSVISFAIPLDRKVIREYLGKKDWLSYGADHKRIYQRLYAIGERLVDFLKGRGFEARLPDMNGVYRLEEGSTSITDQVNTVKMAPDFSHRYGAVAAGLGRIGWSGNLMTPQFGAAVMLGSVLTSAVLKATPLLEEDPCDKCKLCTTVCPVEMIAKKRTTSVTIAGKRYHYGQKGNNARCLIGCSHYHGLGPNKAWSTWSPYRVDYPLPEDEVKLISLSRKLRAADPYYRGGRAFVSTRDTSFDPNWTYISTCGNCQFICWERRQDRDENQRILVGSGVVVLTVEGRRMAVSPEEVTEVDTPYRGVRVAMLRREVRALPKLVNLLKKGAQAAKAAMDTQVLSYLGLRYEN